MPAPSLASRGGAATFPPTPTTAAPTRYGVRLDSRRPFSMHLICGASSGAGKVRERRGGRNASRGASNATCRGVGGGSPPHLFIDNQ